VKKLGEYSAIVNSGALTTCVSNVSHRNGFQSSTFVKYRKFDSQGAKRFLHSWSTHIGLLL
jgi:hypothetical protein